jgi:hypothetical protein
LERLIDNALIYGGLKRINQPHLVERYNQALEAFDLPRTRCTDFVIDATGFSPQVAEDLGDEHYLDPTGISRRFIVLTPEQMNLPVIYMNFSSTPDLMRQFFSENAEAVKNLTLKDVIYGEIENSTYSVDDIEDIMSIKRINFRLSTHNELLEKSKRLTQLVARFRSEPDAWRDDELLNGILELARDCGDIRYNDIVPHRTQFEMRSFWTRHFNGVYVFHDNDTETVVIGNVETADPLPGGTYSNRFINIDDHGAILDYLTETGRVETLNLIWLEHSGLLDQRLEIYTRMAMSKERPETDLVWIGDVATDNWVHNNLGELNRQPAYRFLSELRKAIRSGLVINPDHISPSQMLIALRAEPGHPDALLVNRFLSEFVPFDFLTRFIVNKHAFYKDYESFTDTQRDYAVHTITTRYFPAKQAVWQRLFED